jgi:hypothetical protein
MEAFKYCTKEVMHKLLSRDELRVGTVYGWRKGGGVGEMVQDVNDGSMDLSGNLVFYDHASLNYMIVDSDPVAVDSDGLRHFRNRRVRCEDHYAFCVATRYSAEDHRKWKEVEGYDACYRIKSARLFFRAISGALRDARFLLSAACLYFDPAADNNVFTGRFHPGLLKRSDKFGEQYELRALWEPVDRTSPIEYRDIRVPGIKRYCEPHAVLPNCGAQ